MNPVEINPVNDRNLKSPKPIISAITLCLAMAVSISTSAIEIPGCKGGYEIWNSSYETSGCVFPASDWDSSTAALCNGITLFEPSGGDCYVCVTPDLAPLVLAGIPLNTGSRGSSPTSQIFYCLSDPGYERLVNGTCVEDAWYTLLSWYPMDETSGATISDANSNNYEGTIFGASRTAGWIEGGLSFDGLNDYVNIPDASGFDFGTGDFSVDFWIKTSQKYGVQSILDKRVSGPYRGWHVYTYNGKLGLQLADGGYSNFTSSVEVANGVWHHVAITVERNSPSGIKFYLDGQKVGLSENPTGRSGSLSNSSPLRIATRSLNLSGFWKGTLDELGLHSGAMDPATIAALADQDSRGKCEP